MRPRGRLAPKAIPWDAILANAPASFVRRTRVADGRPLSLEREGWWQIGEEGLDRFIYRLVTSRGHIGFV